VGAVKEGVELISHDFDGKAKGAIVECHGGCMCGHWQGEGEMGCRMWLGFAGGVGAVG